MYNTDLPNRADLPTSGQLKRSTVTAAAIAFLLLVTVVMPSEYGVDPTRVGRLLGLTEMGEIKVQLATEAAADAGDKPSVKMPRIATASLPDELTDRIERIERLLITLTSQVPALPSESPAFAENIPPVAEVVPQEAQSTPMEPAAAPGRQDQMTLTLTPGQGAEVKLVMKQGAVVNYAWVVEGGVVNFDTHGDGGGQSASYEKGRSIPSDEGQIEAAFDGNHGWFWRNRGDVDVTLTLTTQGDYIEIKRVI